MFGELNPLGGGDPIPLRGKKLMIGRRPSCDIVLAFPNISSHHCELELKKGYWHVRDLNSANGVKVNGERCMTKCLYPGDELSVGKIRFKLEYKVIGDGPAPDEENPIQMSLLEKAGLEVERAAGRTPGSPRVKDKAKRPSRLTAEDDFLVEWFPEK